MTLPFREEIVNDKGLSVRNFENPNFIGYLSPYGCVVDYSRPLGYGGHDVNPYTEFFQHYFYLRESDRYEYNIHYLDGVYNSCEMEKIEAKEMKEELEKLYVNHYKEHYKRKMERRRKEEKLGSYYSSYDESYDLKEDLVKFFYNCYSSETFEKGFGKDVTVMSEDEFATSDFLKIRNERDRVFPIKNGESYRDYLDRIPVWYHFDTQYEKYKTEIYLNFLKDVLVSYLGYHYVARTPKTIYTSSFNIYETFYNYLLNDFVIYQMPKMVYDPVIKKYEELKFNELFIPESELILKNEIESIRRMVPLERRKEYYR